MFRKIQDFLQVWKDESGSTLSVFNAVTDGAKTQAVGEGFRDLQRLAWHTGILPEAQRKWRPAWALPLALPLMPKPYRRAWPK
ncbi:MAG TPA: hypothetical protein VHA30_00155 [Patescibacteria group bacterium]|nr:hypothetical protein [Patescibacteria group bacterium]